MLGNPGDPPAPASSPRDTPSRVFGQLQPSIGYGRSSYPVKPMAKPMAAKAPAPEAARSRAFDPSIEPSAAPLVVAFLAIVVAFLLFAGGALADTRLMVAAPEHGWNGTLSWLWIPTLLSLALGVLFAAGLRGEMTRRARAKQVSPGR